MDEFELKQNIETVFDRIVAQIETEEDAECWAHQIDFMLDQLGESDFFGTEGSTDPRGDMRNGSWSVFDIEE